MRKKSKILVLGASGFIGQQILHDWGAQAVGTYKNKSYKNTVYFNPMTMRINQIHGIEYFSHAVILYGEREPDRCWQKPEFTHQLNVESTKRVILDCIGMGIVPVFASSEMVFSGDTGMYKETDLPNPILLYGKYKVEVEQFLRENLENYIVFRLSKVIGTTKNDRSLFANWLAKLDGSQSRSIKCAQDQYFSVIAVSDVSRILHALIFSQASGVFHFSDGIRHNRLELLNLFLNRYERITARKFKVEPVSINDFDLPEARPLDLSMSATKIASINSLGFVTPSECIQKLIG